MASTDQRVNVGIGVVLLDDEGRVLLGKRIHNKHGKGEYSLPGGKPDPGESPEVAALRELEEETGIKADFASPMGVWTYDRYDDYGVHFVTLYFLVDHGDQQPANTEPEKCESWDWYPTDELPAPLFSGVQRVVGLLA